MWLFRISSCFLDLAFRSAVVATCFSLMLLNGLLGESIVVELVPISEWDEPLKEPVAVEYAPS